MTKDMHRGWTYDWMWFVSRFDKEGDITMGAFRNRMQGWVLKVQVQDVLPREDIKTWAKVERCGEAIYRGTVRYMLRMEEGRDSARRGYGVTRTR